MSNADGIAASMLMSIVLCGGCQRSVPISQLGPAKQDSPQQAASFRLLASDGTVILSERDLESYDWPTHTLVLRPGVVAKLRSERIGQLVHGSPFTMEANGVVCYEGVFTSSDSSVSQSCPVIIFDSVDTDPKRRDTELSITLGYPTSAFFRGTDPRADNRVRGALVALGKLKE